MISEHQFAASYPSIWNQVAPLGDGFWHSENMLARREMSPIVAIAAIGLRGVVNEAGFRAFCSLRSADGQTSRTAALNAVDAVTTESVEYVDRLAPAAKIVHESFDDSARQEAASLALRLTEFFPGERPIHLRPMFPGCGLISTCEGDVIEGDCLYEIKAGERAFRINDLRQLLVYSALAYSSGTMHFRSVGLFNPRTGASWRRTLDYVCDSIAGMTAVDTLSNLVDRFSGVSVSN